LTMVLMCSGSVSPSPERASYFCAVVSSTRTRICRYFGSGFQGMYLF
jgi:hypothetical protein